MTNNWYFKLLNCYLFYARLFRFLKPYFFQVTNLFQFLYFSVFLLTLFFHLSNDDVQSWLFQLLCVFLYRTIQLIFFLICVAHFLILYFIFPNCWFQFFDWFLFLIVFLLSGTDSLLVKVDPQYIHFFLISKNFWFNLKANKNYFFYRSFSYLLHMICFKDYNLRLMQVDTLTCEFLKKKINLDDCSNWM